MYRFAPFLRICPLDESGGCLLYVFRINCSVNPDGGIADLIFCHLRPLFSRMSCDYYDKKISAASSSVSSSAALILFASPIVIFSNRFNLRYIEERLIFTNSASLSTFIPFSTILPFSLFRFKSLHLAFVVLSHPVRQLYYNTFFAGLQYFFRALCDNLQFINICIVADLRQRAYNKSRKGMTK